MFIVSRCQWKVQLVQLIETTTVTEPEFVCSVNDTEQQDALVTPDCRRCADTGFESELKTHTHNNLEHTACLHTHSSKRYTSTNKKQFL